MCGIVGVASHSRVAPVLLKALKNLEYRGYDSAGMATSFEGRLQIRKGVGKLAEVQSSCDLDTLPGLCGIGHVRWATHGAVTRENAHPHSDCTHGIALVHNGIVENYRQLKECLLPRHAFTSETDTEIIAHLIEEEMGFHYLNSPAYDPSISSGFDEESAPAAAPLSGSSAAGRPHHQSHIVDTLQNPSPVTPPAPNQPANPADCCLERAVYAVTRQLKGSYAILVVSSAEPGKIVAARQDSPLVIGLGPQANFLASDVLCFQGQADRVIYVEDGETVVLTADSVLILDSEFRPVTRPPVLLTGASEQATKRGYPHFMMKSIFEQPQSIRNALDQDSQMIMDTALEMLRAKQIVLTGCGTSRHSALVGRYAFSKLAGIFSEVVMGSEFQYFADSVDKNTVVIAISQSGETADIIQSVKVAKHKGARVISLINTPYSTLSRLSDRTLPLQCGPEIAVAATKSFISQLTVFYLLAFAMQNRMADGIRRILPLADLIQQNLESNGKGLAHLAQSLKNQRDFYFLGRGINYAIAGEGALKLKEIAYVHAEGLSAGELKHGTLALIESGTPVIALCPSDYTRAETLSNVMETKARGAFVIGVSDQPDPSFDEWIHIPAVEEIFYPLVSIIPLQLLAYHSALARSHDPDKPRNLAKSVTVK